MAAIKHFGEIQNLTGYYTWVWADPEKGEITCGPIAFLPQNARRLAIGLLEAAEYVERQQKLAESKKVREG